MVMAIKIGIIGAGSGIFSLNLVKDLCLTPALHGSEIWFMDIDEERLDASYTLCSRYAQELGFKLNITKTTDRRACLEGADFIINTILIGGYQGWKEGWEIGKKWGFRFGGSLHVMHDEAFWINFYQLQMMEDVLLDIKKYCPDAWYLMVANPVLAGTTYLRRKYPEVKMVGLCHGYSGIYHVAKQLGINEKDMTFQIPGVNHFVWLNSFYYKGQDAFPLIDRWIEEKSEEYFKTCKYCDGMGPKAIDLYKRYGVFPVGDTGNPGGGAWGSFYHTDDAIEKLWNEDPDTWFRDYFAESSGRLETIKAAAYNYNKNVTDMVGRESSHEPMIPLIEAIACDKERVIIVNVLNDRGYVPGVPTDFEVEVPALCSKRGIQPVATIPLPKAVLAYIHRDRIAPVEMELEAIRTHDKNLLVDLVMMDPFCTSRVQAEGLVEEILNLPYHTEMKAWYETTAE